MWIRREEMSYDIRLLDPVTRKTLHTDAPHDMRGGTYVVGGTTELWLNIILARPDVLGEKGLEVIYGMSGAESIPVLKKAVENLGDDINPDYWESTEGNVKKALLQLIAMAQLRPDGVWDGD